ncbi:MAG TPA: ABC transporter substrate-binding protein [Xanthobacteraceae bacterium]|nr:ABC transporter substrate-binding protein [Xanthobacteraceae bacterium]
MSQELLSRIALAAFVLSAPAIAQAASKSELVLAVQGESEQGYDPTLGWGEYGHPLFQSTLLTRGADLQTQPDLAKSWTLSDDRLTWTVQIRDDARFSDGSALTAADVAFTFNQAAKSGGAVDLTALDRATADGASTVVLRLKEPRITFAESFYTLGIVPQKGYGPNYGRQPIGSGPYRLVRWDRGQQLLVDANPFFYGAKPAFTKLTFLFTGEDTTFAAASAGKLDVAAVPAALAERVPSGMKRVVARTVDNRGLVFPMLPNTGRKTPNGAAIGNDVTADKAIRLAINIAIDRRALVSGVLLGHGTPAYGPADTLPWSNPEDRLPDADPARAAQILDDAGWKMSAAGVRTKGGREARFSVLYFADDSTRQMLALAVAEMLRPLGIVLEPLGKSREEVARLRHANVVLYGWGSHNPLEVYELYDSKLAGTESYNTGFYANPKVDAYFAAAQNAPSFEASLPYWRDAEWDGETGYGVRGDAAWAWLVNLEHVYFVNACIDVGRVQVEPHGHGWPITAGILNWRWTCN